MVIQLGRGLACLAVRRFEEDYPARAVPYFDVQPVQGLPSLFDNLLIRLAIENLRRAFECGRVDRAKRVCIGS